MIDVQAGHLDKKSKRVETTHRGDIHVKTLGSLVQLGKDEPAQFLTRHNDETDGLVQEKRIDQGFR